MNKFINDDNFNNLTLDYIFSTIISRYKAPEFLYDVRSVFNNYIKQSEILHGIDEIYPCIMTESMIGEDQTINFEKFIADLSWEILKRQGYGVDNFYTQVLSMFGQSHKRTSGMEAHNHGSGAYLTGLYFIDTPLDSCRVSFQDPKHIKASSGLIEADYNIVTPATNILNFAVEPGELIITNSWLQHSITRNRNILPFNFVHFTIGLVGVSSTNIPSGPIII